MNNRLEITIVQSDSRSLQSDCFVQPAENNVVGVESRNPKELLISLYRDTLEVADKLGLKSIAFPCIDVNGVYGYDQKENIKFIFQIINSLSYRSLTEIFFYSSNKSDIVLYKKLLTIFEKTA